MVKASTVLRNADSVLRATGLSQPDRPSLTPLDLLLCIVIFGMTYGAVMGSFGGFAPDRALQIFYTAVKVPMLLLVSFAISLPSYFVVSTLLGLRGDFGESLWALLCAQAGLTVVLASLAPLTALWYFSNADYYSAILINGLLFGGASVSAQFILRRLFRTMIARQRRHVVMLRLWLVIYTFVAVQMAWVLRPFVGDPASPTRFFREGAWGNAWEVIARLIWDVVFTR